jgi:hypothetical protein
MNLAPEKNLFAEITDFLATAPSAEEIIAFKPSEVLTERLHELLNKNSSGEISPEELEELEEFSRLNHFMRMLIGKTRLKLRDKK